MQSDESTERTTPRRTARQLEVLALERIAGLIDVHVTQGEGDLWGDLEDGSDWERDRFARYCLDIKNRLADRATALRAHDHAKGIEHPEEWP